MTSIGEVRVRMNALSGYLEEQFPATRGNILLARQIEWFSNELTEALHRLSHERDHHEFYRDRVSQFMEANQKLADRLEVVQCALNAEKASR